MSMFQTKPTPRAHINLPKLQIHPFDGNPLEWLTFWDSYSNAVHNNQELKKIDKMNYLKGLITCNTARAISGLPMTSQNYEKAIEILKERFGRNQVLINAHMESLSKISAPSADVQQLRKFYNSCESNIRALETLGVQTDSYGSLLIPILLKKLPEQLRCTIFRTNPQADCSLNDLRTALCHEIDTREKSQLTQENDTSSVVDDVLVPTVGALLTNTQPRQIHLPTKSFNTNGRFELKPCIYCDGKHRHDKCSKIKDKAKGKRPAIIHQLGLYLDDDGLIRCRGRLQYAQLPHNTKFPILMPKESHLSTLIVRATHSMVLHGGVRETLTELRQSYWILKGRQLVKKEIRKCVTCRKVEGPPFRSVNSPPLPDIRVTGSQPFQVTGIDYAGPLYVRNANKEVTKVYICLFTCTAIRAVHLELVEDQTASAFLRAFKRFASIEEEFQNA